MNETLQSILNRRSTRAFTRQKVDEADLALIMQAAVYAPTPSNTQNWHFTVVTNPEKLKAIAEVTLGALRRTGAQFPDGYSFFYDAPALVIVSCKVGDTMAGATMATALENIFVAAQSLGIASCWVSQLAWNPNDPELQQLMRALGVPEGYVAGHAAALGYAKEPAAIPPKNMSVIDYIK